MNKIDEQLQWIAANATSHLDDIVMIELEKINQLYEKYQDDRKEIFVDEIIKAFSEIIKIQNMSIGTVIGYDSKVDNIISAFCDMIKIQKTLISHLEDDGEDVSMFIEQPDLFRYVSNRPNTADESKREFTTDEQIQKAFTSYCMNSKKSLSSYTANDYCSRIRNLWKNFYEEYKKKSGDCGNFDGGKIIENCPLLNVYNQIEFFSTFVEMQIYETNGNRNWTNARAALNKFLEFKLLVENQ